MIGLDELLEAMAPSGARVVGPVGARSFDGFAYDSRKLRPGEIFLAVRTDRADGHEFIPEAVKRGATGVIADRADVEPIAGVTMLVVDDTRPALKHWARDRFRRFRPRVIAVTGRIGKTSASKAIATILARGHDRSALARPSVFESDNHNTLYGLPIALGRLTPAHEFAVLEFAGDGPGDLAELAELSDPFGFVVTGSFPRSGVDDRPAREVEAIGRNLPPDGFLALNARDSALARVASWARARVIWYGWGTELANEPIVSAEDVRLTTDGTWFRLVSRLTGASGEAVVQTRRLGRPAVDATLAGVAVALALGYSFDDVRRAVGQVEPIAGRLNPLPGRAGATIVDDTFSSTAESLDAALDVLSLWDGKRVLILGEPGPLDDGVSGRIAERIALSLHPTLITLGSGAEEIGLRARDLGDGAASRNATTLTESPEDAAVTADPLLGPDTVMLVKGGEAARLERVVERLIAEPERAPELLVRQDRGWKQRVFLSDERPTWVEVDLAAIGHNVSRIKQIVGPDVALLAVLKADAYGHGALRVARTALLHGAEYLATACVSEAVALRDRGIRAPILVLGYTPPWQARDIVARGLTATVYSLDLARQLSRAAVAEGDGPTPVHVKVDTGMSRLGLLPRDVVAFVEALRELVGVEIEGVYTHFACADAADPASALEQLARFRAVLDELDRIGVRPRYVHAANSAALLRFPAARFSMVRAGIAMYGLDPSPDVPCPPDFKPALTFKTLIGQVKDLPTGTPISYGGTYVTRRPSRIAVLPVGYGDGFRRSPRNWGEVLVRGRRAPIVGVVCMDMTMIDVTDFPGVHAGDEAVLIGRQGAETITVADVAARIGTIPYEVVTQILARVPREVAGAR